MITRKVVFTLLLSLIAITSLNSPLSAQGYPSKAVTMVVPYPPGGRTDLTGRIVSQFLKTNLGQPVVIVNKAGAGGVLGAREVAGSQPDGYTLGFFSTGFMTAQYTVPTPTNAKEYELVALINMDPASIAVSSKTPWVTLKELLEYGRKNPGKLRAGINPGSSAQIFAAAFLKAGGIEALQVPFKGGSERVTALAGGHIDIDFDIVAPFKPMLEGGKIRILGVASNERVDLYRDIPTMKEQGVDLVIGSWHGVFAPKGTPREVITALNQALEKTSRDPAFIDQMNKTFLGVRYLNQADFSRFFQEEDQKTKQIIKDLGLLVSNP
jgi:tripartite-type tricarboxylate transporter receptor subunit TctC